MLLFLYSLLLFTPAPSPPEDIVGTWVNQDQDAHIAISRQGDHYQGVVVWIKEPLDPEGNPWQDRKNPDEALRTRQIMGITIVSGLQYEDGDYVDGQIYSPKNGRYADVDIKLLNHDTLELDISVTWYYSVSQTWTRL